jgi:ABC-2 type transport system permease protein
MRLYWEIAVRSFRRATVYRSAYVAGMLTNAFFGAVLSFVYLALYAAGGSVGGFSERDAVSYVWVAQALISVGGGWIFWDLAENIRSGDVVSDLSRPWDFYGYWLSKVLGERVFNLLVRGSVTYLIGALYFRAYVPGPAELAGFAAAILLAMVVSFAYSFLVNLSAFWLMDVIGVGTVASLVMGFFSGFLLPLAFFPPWLAAVAALLPFQAIVSVPAEIFLGRVRGEALLWALLLQVFWAVAMTGLALLVLRAAVRKVVVQGG